MAPWPDRLDSYRPPVPLAPPPPPPQPPVGLAPPAPVTLATGSIPLRSRSSAAASHYATQTSRMSAFEVVDGSQLAVSSDSEDEVLQPSKPSRPHHGRSLSHPFPSLFANKKKKAGRPPVQDSDSDSTFDEAVRMSNSKSKAQPTRPHKAGQSSGNKDFATGNCMTCGSLVRWPRELRVFRCTICLTINDLLPVSPSENREDPSRDKSPADEGSPQRQQPPRTSKSSASSPAVR